jgi:hypothetical protein
MDLKALPDILHLQAAPSSRNFSILLGLPVPYLELICSCLLQPLTKHAVMYT